MPLIEEISTRGDIMLTDNLAEADIGLVQGDTEETAAGALLFQKADIPIAHMYGGDITEGGWPDDFIRDKVSKMSDLHFPSTKKSAQRLVDMGCGTIGHNIFNDGDPVFDMINRTEIMYNRDERPLAIVHLHMDDFKEVQPNIQGIIEEVLNELDFNYVIMNDRAEPFEPHIWYDLMSRATVFIGNSSSGIAEAPSFDLPFVHIGKRQLGREHAWSTQWAEPTYGSIRENVRTAKIWKRANIHPTNPYDIYKDTKNAKRIIDRIIKWMETEYEPR